MAGQKYIFTETGYVCPGEWVLEQGDAALSLVRWPSNTVRCWVTSPPYYKQVDYGHQGQWGQEDNIDAYIIRQQGLAAEMLRCSKDDANLFWVVRDSGNASGGTGGDYIRADGTYRVRTTRGARIKGYPRKGQLLIPERTRIAFQKVGWVPILNIIWDKRDPRRAAKDRPSYSYEHILLFAKSPDHFWNRGAVLKPFSKSSLKQIEKPYNGQARSDYANTNQESPSDTKRRIIKAMEERQGAYLTAVWHIPSGNQPVINVNGEEVRGIASFPELLAKICISLGSERGDVIGDPYAGMGTTAKVALELGRQFRGVELNPLYHQATLERTRDLRWKQQLLLRKF